MLQSYLLKIVFMKQTAHQGQEKIQLVNIIDANINNELQ